MFLGSTLPRNITYIPWPRCLYSLMFVKIYSSVMLLGCLRNISYVPRASTYVPQFLFKEHLFVSYSVFWNISSRWSCLGTFLQEVSQEALEKYFHWIPGSGLGVLSTPIPSGLVFSKEGLRGPVNGWPRRLLSNATPLED
jgi:hypothetical protein